MMTNYDKYIATRRQKIKEDIKALEEMTPLLAAIAIDEQDTKRDECSLIEDFGEPVERCTGYCLDNDCVGCIKAWLAEEVIV